MSWNFASKVPVHLSISTFHVTCIFQESGTVGQLRVAFEPRLPSDSRSCPCSEDQAMIKLVPQEGDIKATYRTSGMQSEDPGHT